MYSQPPTSKTCSWWGNAMEHRDFGEETPLEHQQWSWISPEYNLGRARPIEANPEYFDVGRNFRSIQHEREQQVWWPKPPPTQEVIQEEMLQACFQYQETIGFLNSEKAQLWTSRFSHLSVEEKTVQHYLASNRSALLNQSISVSQKQYKETPATLNQSRLRRRTAGIGYRNKAVAK